MQAAEESLLETCHSPNVAQLCDWAVLHGVTHESVIDYDFAKYGSATERRRLLDRWVKEINAVAK
jgi:hypothetical protein